MKMFLSLTDPKLVRCLQKGGVVVIPTDTVYGLVARAEDEQAVERVYQLRGRAPQKPCIILIAGREQITDDAAWTPQHSLLADAYWPGPLSLIAPTTFQPEYLHRGTVTLAYRVPARDDLRALLAQTGPLVAPSANPEGAPTATTLSQAQAYFGNTVDGYVDGGNVTGVEPSTVARIVDGNIQVLRPGAAHITDKTRL